MTCNNLCSAKQSPVRSLVAMFVAFFFISFGAISVGAANDASAQDEAGEIRIKSERIPAENASAANSSMNIGQQVTHGRIELRGGAGESISQASVNQQSENANLLQRNSADPIRDTTHPENSSGKKKSRPRPDPNFAGTSIGKAGTVSAPVVDEKKHSINKRGEATKARHVKSVVEYGDSPELKSHNEKRQKIKEHFKTNLENREDRKAKKMDRQVPTEGISK